MSFLEQLQIQAEKWNMLTRQENFLPRPTPAELEVLLEAGFEDIFGEATGGCLEDILT